MTGEERAELVIRALGGHHLYSWLPGNDHKAARSAVVTGGGGWSAKAGAWGHVTATGVGVWRTIGDESPRTALQFVTWPEVIQIVADGCGEGRREQYEAAYAAWGEWARAAHDYPAGGTPPRHDHEWYSRATAGLHETTAAIIRSGCAIRPVQPTLF